MSIDPNGCNFWYTNEYVPVAAAHLAGRGQLETRIVSFRLNPNCTPIGDQPPAPTGLDGHGGQRTSVAELDGGVGGDELQREAQHGERRGGDDHVGDRSIDDGHERQH